MLQALFIFWANFLVGKCLFKQMSFWADVLLGKCLLGICLSGQMYFWANVLSANILWANVHLGKCLSGQMSSVQMSSGQMSFWANVFGQMSYRRCLTTYLGSSATQAMCASWQASTIADMPDMVI
jgi:hypothetical protein